MTAVASIVKHCQAEAELPEEQMQMIEVTVGAQTEEVEEVENVSTEESQISQDT